MNQFFWQKLSCANYNNKNRRLKISEFILDRSFYLSYFPLDFSLSLKNTFHFKSSLVLILNAVYKRQLVFQKSTANFQYFVELKMMKKMTKFLLRMAFWNVKTIVFWHLKIFIFWQGKLVIIFTQPFHLKRMNWKKKSI